MKKALVKKMTCRCGTVFRIRITDGKKHRIECMNCRKMYLVKP